MTFPAVESQNEHVGSSLLDHKSGLLKLLNCPESEWGNESPDHNRVRRNTTFSSAQDMHAMALAEVNNSSCCMYGNWIVLLKIKPSENRTRSISRLRRSSRWAKDFQMALWEFVNIAIKYAWYPACKKQRPNRNCLLRIHLELWKMVNIVYSIWDVKFANLKQTNVYAPGGQWQDPFPQRRWRQTPKELKKYMK